MKLIELEPQFLKEDVNNNRIRHRVETLEEANLLMFLCPSCFRKNNGPSGTHQIVIQTVAGWKCEGNLENLTVSPSILADSSPMCKTHFFIKNGEIIVA